MQQTAHIVKPRKKAGPQGRWMAQASRDLGVSLGHLWQVATGRRVSDRLSARITEWRKQNKQ